MVRDALVDIDFPIRDGTVVHPKTDGMKKRIGQPPQLRRPNRFSRSCLSKLDFDPIITGPQCRGRPIRLEANASK